MNILSRQIGHSSKTVIILFVLVGKKHKIKNFNFFNSIQQIKLKNYWSVELRISTFKISIE
jgi:hypothetical protein